MLSVTPCLGKTNPLVIPLTSKPNSYSKKFGAEMSPSWCTIIAAFLDPTSCMALHLHFHVATVSGPLQAPAAVYFPISILSLGVSPGRRRVRFLVLLGPPCFSLVFLVCGELLLLEQQSAQTVLLSMDWDFVGHQMWRALDELCKPETRAETKSLKEERKHGVCCEARETSIRKL